MLLISLFTGIPAPQQVNPQPHHRNTRNRDSFVSWRAAGNPVKGLTRHMEMAMIDTRAPLHPGRDLKLNADGPALVLRWTSACSDIPVFDFPETTCRILTVAGERIQRPQVCDSAPFIFEGVFVSESSHTNWLIENMDG